MSHHTCYTDSGYLKNAQYADSSNLNARIRLHQLYDTNPYPLQCWMFDRMLEDAPGRRRILELGCGSGEFWNKNREHIPAEWTITLSDFSPGMLKDAQERLSDLPFDYQVIDVQQIPFADHTFDVVMAHFMLYHVPDRPKALAEIRRVLKPDGCMHAMTLGKNHMRELHEFLYSIAPFAYPDHGAISRPFSLENGEAQLAESFGAVRLVRYDSALDVTDAQPLSDYVLSMNDALANVLTEDQRQQFTGIAQQHLDAHNGIFHITKDSGLFVARDYAGV